MAQVLSLIGICFLGAGVYFIKWLFNSRRHGPLPPGPTGWPVIGNVFDIPMEKSWEGFAALGRKYGDISTVTMMGTRYVVLNSLRAVSAVLEKHSAICSDRPRLTMASDLVGFDKVILFMDHNEPFREQRKLFHRLMGTKASAAAFNPIEEEETSRLICKVLQNPDGLVDHIRSTAGAIILKVTYGYSVREKDDPFVEIAENVMRVLVQVAYPGRFLVDTIPALRYLPEWFPGAGFLRDAKKHRQLTNEAISRPFQYVTEQMAAGTEIPSFASTLLQGEMSPEKEDIIKWVCMALYLGASDTVVATIHSFFLAMVLFPEVQAKAQAELDVVVGTERLPSFDDRDSLPYINAVCKEVLRWHSVTPLAMTHAAREDIYFGGFLIPKGSCIVPNTWAILHDASTYPDPGAFRPERFLGETPQPDPQAVCFGFGRRTCPGFHLAEAALFISVAMSLAVLKISKVVVDGVEVAPEVEVSSGIVSHLKPFRCRIGARSPRAEALLHT